MLQGSTLLALLLLLLLSRPADFTDAIVTPPIAPQVTCSISGVVPIKNPTTATVAYT